MTSEEYKEKLKAVKLALGELTCAVTSDLQRLESAATENTQAKVKAAYERGITEAVDACKKIVLNPCWGGYDSETLEKIFGEGSVCGQIILRDRDPIEAVETVKFYESRKKAEERARELNVGDVVRVEDHSRPVVVMKVEDEEEFYGYDGITFRIYPKICAEKTGRRIEATTLMEKEILKEFEGR